MPSPFPGMDPYLEGSNWMSFHAQLSAEIARQLAPKLRPKYLARLETRFVIELPEDLTIARSSIYPDTAVVPRHRISETTTYARAATLSLPLQMVTVVPDAVPHMTVEIRDVAHRELVTAIEVLSPTNKRGDGRVEYLAKRRGVLLSKAHLIEIDFLRQGQRIPMERDLPPAPYFVFVSRSERRPLADVWPIQMDQPLPVIPVPLLEGDDDVPLDLQLAFSNVYDAVGYDLELDYSAPPEIPLTGADADWAEERLRRMASRSTPAAKE